MPHRAAHPGRLATALTSLAVTATLVLASCSGGGDDDGRTSSDDPTAETSATVAPADPTAEGTSSTTESRPDPATDAAMERAERLNLTIDDLPSGWQNFPQAEAEVGVVEVCSSVDLYAHLVALARSDAFMFTIEPGTLQASSGVTILDHEAQAVAMLADFRDDTFVECATDTLRRGTDTYTISGGLSRNETEPDLGDEAVALSGDFTITPTDGSPPHSLSAIVVAIRRGDVVVTFSSTATDRRFDEQTTRGLLTTLDERLAG